MLKLPATQGPESLKYWYPVTSFWTMDIMSLFCAILILWLNIFLVSGQQCGTTLSSSSGSIQSPGYPVNYPADLSCSWQITAVTGYVIELTIGEFNLEESVNCGKASLTVYDGLDRPSSVLLPPSCGSRISWPSQPTTVLSTNQLMTVVFSTRMSTRYNETGFRATYRQVLAKEEFFLAIDTDNSIIYKQNRFGVNFDTVDVIGLERGVAIDYDPVEERVYFSDVRTGLISRCNIDGTNQEVVADNLVETPDGLEVDPVSRLIYWTDTSPTRPMISVARLDGTYRRILFESGVEKPRDIVVYTQQGHIYWSDWGSLAKIERANGDGTDRNLIISSGLGWPNGISLDIAGGKLYWADARLNKIERSNLDGSLREELRAFTVDVHPYSLIFHDDALFWTDWITRGIDVTDSDFLNDPTTLIVAGVPTKFHGLAFYSSSDPPVEVRDCSLGGMNSQCEELCVSLPSGPSCLAVVPVFDECPKDIAIIANRVTVAEWREPIVTSPSNLGVSLTSSHQGNSLTVSPIDGTIPVTYSAIDELGNTAACSFNIVVIYDSAPPNVSCPADINLQIPESEDSAPVTWDDPEVTDDTETVILMRQTHHSGDTFGLGVTTVTYRYEDTVGNPAECQFQVDVTHMIVGPTTTTTVATPAPPDMMMLVVIVGSVVIVVIIAVVVSFIFGKCVTCQCQACKKDEPTQNPGVFANPGFTDPRNKLSHPVQRPQHVYTHHAPPSPAPPNHIYLPHADTYARGLAPPPASYGRYSRGSHGSKIYQEIPYDPPAYSQNRPSDEPTVYSRGFSNNSYLEVEDGESPTEPPLYSRGLGGNHLQVEGATADTDQYTSMKRNASSSQRN